jgi:hypothetical protein
MDQHTLLHQHGNLKHVRENLRRTPDLPTIETYRREGHRLDLLVIAVCIFALGVATGLALCP